MKACVVYPERAHSAYQIAANAFADYAAQITGVRTVALTDDQYQLSAPDADVTVLIGNDAVLARAAELLDKLKPEPEK